MVTATATTDDVAIAKRLAGAVIAEYRPETGRLQRVLGYEVSDQRSERKYRTRPQGTGPRRLRLLWLECGHKVYRRQASVTAMCDRCERLDVRKLPPPTIDGVLSRCRSRALVEVRWVCWSVLVNHCGWSVTRAANAFGLDHASVSQALSKMQHRDDLLGDVAVVIAQLVGSDASYQPHPSRLNATVVA